MNIFFLHKNVRKCARMHVDKHVVKMILETCQMLCAVHHLMESSYTPPYKLAHKNHPCTKWARESVSNYNWLVELGLALCEEYTFRYEKTHKSEQYIREMKMAIPSIPDIGFTSPAQAMPDKYKNTNPVLAYRKYYFYDKASMFAWKKRNTPRWIVNTQNFLSAQACI